jgi:Putative restriction endonuclease
MNAMAVAQRTTADEYLADPDATVRSELVEGVVIVQEPTPLHQWVVMDLFRALDAWISADRGRGQYGFPST